LKVASLATGAGVIALIVVAGGLLEGRQKTSESVLDESAGMNGGFEIVKAGLPVNWLVYTRKTLPAGDYDLVIDTAEHRAGKQSLKFVVRQWPPGSITRSRTRCPRGSIASDLS